MCFLTWQQLHTVLPEQLLQGRTYLNTWIQNPKLSRQAHFVSHTAACFYCSQQKALLLQALRVYICLRQIDCQPQPSTFLLFCHVKMQFPQDSLNLHFLDHLPDFYPTNYVCRGLEAAASSTFSLTITAIFIVLIIVQISLLKQSLEMQLSQSQSSLQQLQHQFSQEREHLRMQLEELQTEHQRRQQRLQEAHRCAMQDMEHARQRDLKVTHIKVTQKGCYRAFCQRLIGFFFFLIKKNVKSYIHTL